MERPSSAVLGPDIKKIRVLDKDDPLRHTYSQGFKTINEVDDHAREDSQAEEFDIEYTHNKSSFMKADADPSVKHINNYSKAQQETAQKLNPGNRKMQTLAEQDQQNRYNINDSENPSNSSIDLHSFFDPLRGKPSVNEDDKEATVYKKGFSDVDTKDLEASVKGNKFSSPINNRSSAKFLKETGMEELKEFAIDRADALNNEEKEEASDELIKLINVHKTYLMGLEGVQALRGVNLTVK